MDTALLVHRYVINMHRKCYILSFIPQLDINCLLRLIIISYIIFYHILYYIIQSYFWKYFSTFFYDRNWKNSQEFIVLGKHKLFLAKGYCISLNVEQIAIYAKFMTFQKYFCTLIQKKYARYQLTKSSKKSMILHNFCFWNYR